VSAEDLLVGVMRRLDKLEAERAFRPPPPRRPSPTVLDASDDEEVQGDPRALPVLDDEKYAEAIVRSMREYGLASGREFVREFLSFRPGVPSAFKYELLYLGRHYDCLRRNGLGPFSEPSAMLARRLSTVMLLADGHFDLASAVDNSLLNVDLFPEVFRVVSLRSRLFSRQPRGLPPPSAGAPGRRTGGATAGRGRKGSGSGPTYPPGGSVGAPAAPE